MCIRDSIQGADVFDLYNNCTNDVFAQNNDWRVYDSTSIEQHVFHKVDNACLLYTSDAADERSSVDLGGRRIIKKKKKIYIMSGRCNNHKRNTKTIELCAQRM